MYDYDQEVKTQIIQSVYKIAIPLLVSIYLLFNIVDRIVAPHLANHFLLVRLSILPIVLIGVLLRHQKWVGDWHIVMIWICGLTGSLHLTYMAYRSGFVAQYLYLHSVNLVAATLLLLFPLRGKLNWLTLVLVYLPPFLLFLMLINSGFEQPDIAMLSSVIVFLGMIPIFGFSAMEIDRLRYKAFHQKIQLVFLATTDILTGLKLRRYFFNRFIQELSIAFRKNTPLVLSVAILDIDFFKSINDRYGHEVGDQCIKHVAEIIRKRIRVYDVACRFGGEEFIVLFPETSLKEVEGVIQSIVESVRNTPVLMKSEKFSMTISAGISGTEVDIPLQAKKFEGKDWKLLLIKHMMQIIKQADDLLYQSKKSGKNRLSIGHNVEFSTEIKTEEIESLKAYLTYFDEPLLPAQGDKKEPEPVRTEPELNFYPKDYFFRRCVESLYRWTRNPEWAETLAIIRFSSPQQEEIQREIFRMFRLSDSACVLGPGLYAVIFFGISSAALPQIAARIRKVMATALKMEKFGLNIAAAPLQFEPRSFKLPQEFPSYEELSRRVLELFNALKSHRFSPGEEIYYHDPLNNPSHFKAAV
ncbi:MAG: GGDEF domain-containing protein [Candidatus Omnitrophica bacterium]|nr:GGDEF domain-containing protein [Candidatus Omnitrophota bacterium]